MFEYLKDLVDPPIRNHRIFFFHIAKCGGTSISNAIVNCYKPWRLESQTSIVTLHENAARFAEENSLGEGKQFRRDLLNYLMATSKMQCISGHFHYSNIAHKLYHEKWNFITVLRDPVERWFSHYNYNTREGAAKNYRITVPLEEFITTKQAESFGRAFVDEVTEDLDKKNINIENLCQTALERYKKFSLVGSVNNLGEFEQKFEQKFNHKLNIKHLNKTPVINQSKHKEVSDDIFKRVSELCEPDIYLYNKLFN